MKCTKAIFLKDVEKHSLEILLDKGVHRHLRFSNGDSWNQLFMITTWPGYLCISGDMGCFVFSRLNDMFEFFRHKDLGINPDYWHEKLEAVSRHNGSKQYSEERFKERVEQVVKDSLEDENLTKEQIADLRSELEDQVLCAENDIEAHQYLRDFEWYYEDSSGCTISFQFPDSWEYDFSDWTFHYIWCCYAIAWAIQQYDDKMVNA